MVAVPRADTKSLLTHPAFGKIALGVALFETATRVVKDTRNRWEANLAYTVTVTERDPLYTDVHLWLTSVMPAERQRNLVAATRAMRGVSGGSDYDEVPTSGSRDPEADQDPLRLMYNDTRRRRMTIDGHRVSVRLNRADEGGGTNVRRDTPDKIEFTCATRPAQDAVIGHLRSLHEGRKTERQPVLRMVTDWGSWRTRNDLPPRSLNSVSLPPDQLARIVADLGGFLAAEEHYNRLAIPWHRGYMFHGPPGTGKTSLVKALATHFGMDLWYVPLSDLKTENSLMGLLAEVAPRSLLLLEDIDTIQITHDRDTDQGAISMSSLLNALDGVATPHGLITVMTTNHFDGLDPALTRAGRMDMVEEIAAPTWEQVQALGRHFYGPTWALPVGAYGVGPLPVSMAGVAEAFKRHLHDPVAAAAEVTALVNHEGALA